MFGKENAVVNIRTQVYNAIKECATDKGVLLIIKNYSGDRKSVV